MHCILATKLVYNRMVFKYKTHNKTHSTTNFWQIYEQTFAHPKCLLFYCLLTCIFALIACLHSRYYFILLFKLLIHVTVNLTLPFLYMYLFSVWLKHGIRDLQGAFSHEKFYFQQNSVSSCMSK